MEWDIDHRTARIRHDLITQPVDLVLSPGNVADLAILEVARQLRGGDYSVFGGSLASKPFQQMAGKNRVSPGRSTAIGHLLVGFASRDDLAREALEHFSQDA
jgi:hypothetical protein